MVGRATLACLMLTGGFLIGLRLHSGDARAVRGPRASSPAYAFPQTGFGGYQWSGGVYQVSSNWRVPTIAPDSTPGAAATWIGAQDIASSRFIQVGVFEQCVAASTFVYRAFWSDANVKFIPQWIGDVQASDLVSASLVRSGRGWTVRLSDPAAKLAFSTAVAYRAGASFSTGEWIQEDPSPSTAASKDVPYPVMSDVTFQRLEVDGQAPRLSVFNALKLTPTGGGVRVPTSVRNDSFTFSAPTGDGAT